VFLRRAGRLCAGRVPVYCPGRTPEAAGPWCWRSSARSETRRRRLVGPGRTSWRLAFRRRGDVARLRCPNDSRLLALLRQATTRLSRGAIAFGKLLAQASLSPSSRRGNWLMGKKIIARRPHAFRAIPAACPRRSRAARSQRAMTILPFQGWPMAERYPFRRRQRLNRDRGIRVAALPNRCLRLRSGRVAAVSHHHHSDYYGWSRRLYRKFREYPSSVDPSWHEFSSTTPPANQPKRQSTAGTDTGPSPAAPSAQPNRRPPLPEGVSRRPRKAQNRRSPPPRLRLHPRRPSRRRRDAVLRGASAAVVKNMSSSLEFGRPRQSCRAIPAS